jgi:hypothetical protein
MMVCVLKVVTMAAIMITLAAFNPWQLVRAQTQLSSNSARMPIPPKNFYL